MQFDLLSPCPRTQEVQHPESPASLPRLCGRCPFPSHTAHRAGTRWWPQGHLLFHSLRLPPLRLPSPAMALARRGGPRGPPHSAPVMTPMLRPRSVRERLALLPHQPGPQDAHGLHPQRRAVRDGEVSAGAPSGVSGCGRGPPRAPFGEQRPEDGSAFPAQDEPALSLSPGLRTPPRGGGRGGLFSVSGAPGQLSPTLAAAARGPGCPRHPWREELAEEAPAGPQGHSGASPGASQGSSVWGASQAQCRAGDSNLESLRSCF